MRPSTAIHIKHKAIREIIKRYRVANPRIFGSVMHGTDHENSDLDILIDVLPGTTLFDLGGLQEELESTLDTRIDLITPEDLPEHFRAQVLQEAQPL